MLLVLLFAVFCLGFLMGRIVPGLIRRIRAYLYVPRMLAPYHFPATEASDDNS